MIRLKPERCKALAPALADMTILRRTGAEPQKFIREIKSVQSSASAPNR